MNKKISSFIFFLISLLTLNCKAPKLSIKEKNNILEVCNKHVKLFVECELDTLFDYSKMLAVTDSNFTYAIEKRNRYYSLMGSEAFDFDYTVEGMIINDSIFGCKTKMETVDKLTWLDVEKNNGIYKVSGANGYKITKKDLARWDTALSRVPSIIQEKEKIKQTVSRFFAGINQMNSGNDYNKLKNVTTAECYQFLKMSKKIDSLKGSRYKREYVIRKFDYVQIYGDSADCRTLVKGHGGSRINLIRKDSTWLVNGENGPENYQERIEELKSKEITLLKEIKFKKNVPILDSALRELLIANNEQLLKSICSPSCFTWFKKFKTLCGNYNPDMLRIDGLLVNRFIAKIKFSSDTASIEGLYSTFNFIETNNQWKLCGINNKYENSLDLILLTDEFEKIKNAFNFNYGYHNIKSKNEEDTDDSIITVYSFSERKEDTAIRNAITDLNPNASFKGGAKALYSYIETSIDKEKKGLKKGEICISFIVEKDGSISGIKVLDGLNDITNQEAIRLVKEMPLWNPAKKYREIVRSNYYLIIPFN